MDRPKLLFNSGRIKSYILWLKDRIEKYIRVYDFGN